MKSSKRDMEAAKIINKVSPLPLPPFLIDDTIYKELAESPPLENTGAQPLPSWTFSKKQPSGEKLPQTIAHRGYKANFPENSMGAFQGAADVGADAIETDVHRSKDGVVVLSHDATLKRCFGSDVKITDTKWEDMRDVETLRSPKQRIPRLQDLLEFLAVPGHEHLWLLLDIKLSNDPASIISGIASTISCVAPHPSRPWANRIVLGVWATKFLPPCATHLPNYPITHIGFSTYYARLFLRLPHISFNTLIQTIQLPVLGSHFLRSARNPTPTTSSRSASSGGGGDDSATPRPVYTWTVNDPDKMRWCIRESLDGVITDDPKLFREVCTAWEQGRDRRVRGWKGSATGRALLMTLWIQLMVLCFGVVFRWMYGGGGIVLKEKKMNRSRGQGGKAKGMEAEEEEEEGDRGDEDGERR